MISRRRRLTILPSYLLSLISKVYSKVSPFSWLWRHCFQTKPAGPGRVDTKQTWLCPCAENSVFGVFRRKTGKEAQNLVAENGGKNWQKVSAVCTQQLRRKAWKRISGFYLSERKVGYNDIIRREKGKKGKKL